jgi:hypothetical protein
MTRKFYTRFFFPIWMLCFAVPGIGRCQTETLDPPVVEIPGVVVQDNQDEKQRGDGGKVLASSEPTHGQNEPGRAAADRTPSEMSDFLRVKKNHVRKPVAFETSVTRYIGTTADNRKVTVDLIGVVHIGEKSYYQELNSIFDQYETVLYELVAPEGTEVPDARAEESGLNPIAALQKGMQAVLGLEFQLDHVDYSKPNFVHADMSPAEFMTSMKNNDESFAKMFFKAMGHSMSQSNKSTMTNLELLKVAFAKDKEIRMRQVFASQMIDMEAGMAIFEGKDGSTIINHRNGKAFQVLQQQIDSGKSKLAVFYGAGHLPDMHRRLTSDFQMQRAGQYWLQAWKLRR